MYLWQSPVRPHMLPWSWRGGASILLDGERKGKGKGKHGGWRGGGEKGSPPSGVTSRRENVKNAADAAATESGGDGGGGGGVRRRSKSRSPSGTMESASLLAGNVQRLQFLKKKTGIDLVVS